MSVGMWECRRVCVGGSGNKTKSQTCQFSFQSLIG